MAQSAQQRSPCPESGEILLLSTLSRPVLGPLGTGGDFLRDKAAGASS
jgi:hypothetical protein